MYRLRMRISVLVLAAMTTAYASAGQGPASVPACTTSTAACTEWVPLRGGPARSMVYRSYPLDARNDRIRRALIMVHGTNRNADHYFATAMAAAFLAGAVGDTLVIAPHIIGCADKPEPNEVLWSCSGDSWRSGGAAASTPELSSFDLADEILRKLAETATFPNMKAIVVAGHSAGGQYVTRYTMANRVHDTLGVPVTYVVANPSSYAWPVATRPTAADDADPAAAKEGWKSEAVHTKFSYGPYDSAGCQNYNRWPLGFENRTAGYTAKMSEEQLKTQLVARPTTYSARAGGHPATRGVRLIVLGDGAGADASRPRRSVPETRERDARCEASGSDCAGVRPQRSVCVHDGRRVANHLSKVR